MFIINSKHWTTLQNRPKRHQLVHAGRVLLPMFLGLISQPLLSTEANLSLTPSLCVVARDTGRCDISVDVSWKANKDSDYCIYNESSDSPIQCWSYKNQGQSQSKVSINKDIDYWLVWRETGSELDREVLKVVKIMPEDRRRNRRRRHIWSVF